ncbi:MAG TPA: response regulator transcription factor [Opitutaceae bacterium]|jgi:CheY-like chemotaxis protein|nr:response regulator transcription factor [Opitutaceae bacterium]
MNFSGSILLVDDEAHIRKFISLLLRHLGVSRIMEAPNGSEALEVYKRESPDLVMLDVNMPIMDGIETLRALKALNPDAVVVMLTSLANRQTIDEAVALGAANYIRKDAPPEEIGRALADTIDSCFESEEPAEEDPPA